MEFIDYSRQEQFNNRTRIESFKYNGYKIIVVGCGGIGFWAAYMCAMLGFNRFILFDADKVEQSNLNRIPLNPRWVGKPKVLALKAAIRAVRPSTAISVVNAHCLPNAQNFKDMVNSLDCIVLDCTDDARVQIQLNQQTAYCGAMYIKMGYEGTQVGVYNNTSSAWIPDDYQPGYRTTESNVISSSVAAAFGILRMINSNNNNEARNDFTINLENLVNAPQGVYGLNATGERR